MIDHVCEMGSNNSFASSETHPLAVAASEARASASPAIGGVIGAFCRAESEDVGDGHR